MATLDDGFESKEINLIECIEAELCAEREEFHGVCDGCCNIKDENDDGSLFKGGGGRGSVSKNESSYIWHCLLSW